MKALVFLATLCIATTTFAQQTTELEPGKPQAFNGIEFGYEIRNQQTKAVKDESYSRYEITAYVSNKSGCTKIMFPRQTLLGEERQNQLAQFDCLNATGKRLTSKGTLLAARLFVVPYRQSVKNQEGKLVTTTTNVEAGHMLRNGETVTGNFIVIVPEGERPRVQVRVREMVEAF
ncbi:MAG TPA: hypothetical protein VK404_19805 [Spirosoma sp.]|nr:hypothetical protein [Spirosoma sp.]